MKVSQIIAIIASLTLISNITCFEASSAENKSNITEMTAKASDYTEMKLKTINYNSKKSQILKKVTASTHTTKSSIISDFLNDSIDKISDNTVTKSKENVDNAIEAMQVKVINPNVSLASVSSIKITWDAEEGREYDVAWSTYSAYTENVTIVYPKYGLCYITGLRIDTDYDITITPIIKENEKRIPISYNQTIHTSNPEVIQEFDYIDGWTNCFAGEKASGLTAMPSSGAIYGSKCDEITGTGIRRFENGDYCCAMGTHFGYCNDRFLVELDNGIQFTTRICDSKGCGDVQDEYGYGLWHNFGGSGKCIIEFIWDDGNLPNCVAFSGSWGGYNWNGLNLGANIRSIKKLANYDL